METLRSFSPIFGALLFGGLVWLILDSEGLESALVFMAGLTGWGIFLLD